ncbi:nucleotidyltransferase [Lactobacillus paracasei]|uniref:nucleotidyltransferase domain-containing protein n=1 Tax=Lacticaseibacillus paracasei TaxID=1597 RepID=UPI0014367075|nr:nucleotidyltransferase [Lacticaseibacillus paracasei]NKF04609.1 nucleotidyltransferase [Lacticaseibacillus paracasei]
MINPGKQLEDIELTKTQRERAVTLYTHLCEGIQARGLNISFYPQGSFALKTAVRPFAKGKEQAYDVDVICNFDDYSKDELDSGQLMLLLRQTAREVCKERSLEMDYYERCVTVHYADDPSGVSFSIDLIPAVRESKLKLAVLRAKTEESELVETSIAIDSLSKGWITNNPQGYRKWFEEKAAQFDSRFIQESWGAFASVEELPDDDTPSSRLRQSIKLLKRLRDVYYDEIDAKTSSPSVIITTIVTKLAQSISPSVTSLELLDAIIRELNQVFLLHERGEAYATTYQTMPIAKIVMRENGKWVLRNPTNWEDNVLSSWNETGAVASKEFFGWIKSLQVITKDYKKRGQSDLEFEQQFRGLLLINKKSPNMPRFNVNSSNGVNPWKKQ